MKRYWMGLDIGGTKCGALFGEALVITNEALKPRFKACMKQHGAVLAKGWLLGLQFAVMLEGGEYFEGAKRANEQALRIKKAFCSKNIPLWVDSFTNQQFVVVENSLADRLAKKYVFEYEKKIDETHCCIRFCTSWSTCAKEVEELTEDLLAL